MSLKYRKRFPRKLSESDKQKLLDVIVEEVYNTLLNFISENDIIDLVVKCEVSGDIFPTVTVEIDITVNPFKYRNLELKQALNKALERGFERVDKEIEPLRSIEEVK
ncbi:MAG: hypothetical protein DRJ51_01610 [Thermoprotei archaeon]|nr:MAG: hypothetical protein DRJ51_01610 [Thermoprotei archaeon]RLF03288.1 MAG: hypothetical protein DRJ59_01165 [Thermoprotei archaeon]